jgi:16S rRNA (guanine527-N7)-methyltransferase
VRDESTPGAVPRRGGALIQGGAPLDRQREPLPTHVRDTPPLPAAFDEVLDRGLDRLGLTATPEARSAIDGHVRLLIAWTSAINLTAIRHPADIALRHVLDSLAPLAAVPDISTTARILDLGSGGGFPGVPLAAFLPGTHVTLLEPVTKKARFLETVVVATGLGARVAVARARAEALAGDVADRGRWPTVTSRAVGSMAELVELAFPLLVDGGALVAWKRGSLDAELAAARRAMAQLGGGTLEVVAVALPDLAGHQLVVATRTGRVPPGFPRDPSVRRRRPW